jgi:hypothetical protein
MPGEGYGVSLATGRDEGPGDTEASAERVEVGASLRARADDEQGTVGVWGELAGGEHGERGRASRGNHAAFEEAQTLPRRRVHHHDLALYGRQITTRVLRVDRHQLGDGDLLISGGHDQQDAALLKGQGEAGRSLQIVRTHGERDLANGFGKGGIR